MTTKTCFNCAHRYGSKDYARCIRTGNFCDAEMKFGGRCAGSKGGVPELSLWEPKTSFMQRLFGKVKP